MRTTTLFVATGSMVACLNAFAAPPKRPASVAADLKSIAEQCTDVGGKTRTDDAVQRVDLNGDGKEEYVLDVGSIQCDGAASVYGAKLEGTGASAKLWLTVSAEHCGKPMPKNFASESFCDRAVAWNAKARMFEYAPVSTVRMME
jgi:hypothetical protein